ncbi:MAG: ferric reductase-like transmembrane domain-containing protein [Verrucomicrobia subdivision 3 bacterium]|nr:ferric reductase-like transmembrane domain-containing protein [Limisphaerales bacterium]
MGVEYTSVQWNRQKRFYDFALAGGVGAFLLLFGVISKLLFPLITDEILLIRAFGAAAFVLLHVILCIGPLCRLNRRFLPLLYNRRHAGVTMAFLSLVHAVLVIITYHAGGDTNPILSIFKGSPLVGSVAGVPFQPFGFIALVILMLMAATSHDFWLANLSAPVWKSLHMLVYAAYGLLVLHVTFGVLQAEVSPIYVAITALGLVIVLGLHLTAAFKEVALDRSCNDTPGNDGFVDACALADIPEKRARIICLSGERVAIFKYDGKVSAVSNVCQHQNGPLGEGRILDGCITCPWHGYQYLPDTGASPPPFVEKVPTFNVRVKRGRVFVHPKPNPPGTRAEPGVIPVEKIELQTA